MTERVFTDKQERLIEKYRDCNVDFDDWYDCVYEVWEEKLKEKGIELDSKTSRTVGGHTISSPAIYFSGFWSQGDGACFEGGLYMDKFIEAHDLAKDYKAVAFFVASGDSITCSISHNGRYYHSNSVDYNFDCYIETEEHDPVRTAINEAMYEQFESEWGGFQTSVKDICQGYMNEIYSDLEKEYDYLTSDEAVWDAIEANEWDEEDEDELEEAA